MSDNDTLESIKALARRVIPRGGHLWLFGSRARGDNRQDSDWDLAINRYYYACFHALHALFVSKGLVAHTHDGLITIFGKEFVQKQLVDKKCGRYLSRMEQLRIKKLLD